MNDLGTPSILPVCGTPLHWVEVGAGRPLILLHGLGDSHRAWRLAVPALPQNRRILVPDLPGHGLSGRPDVAYDLAWYAGMLGAWIDKLGLDDFDLVGHSYGGGVAQYMLLTHAPRVRRLGLVASGGLGREVATGVRLLTLPGARHVVRPFLGVGTSIGLAISAPSVWDASEARRAAWYNTMPGTARALTRTACGIADLRGQTRHFLDRAHEIHELPPIALYWGVSDPVIPAHHGFEAARSLSNVRLTLFPRCGHFPHLEHPLAFADALRDFLDDADVRRARVVVPVRTQRPEGWLSRLGRVLRRLIPPWRRGAGDCPPSAPSTVPQGIPCLPLLGEGLEHDVA